MFKIIVVLKVICYTPYTEAVVKNGGTDIIYSQDKQYEQFAEITSTDGEVFKVPSNSKDYSYFLSICGLSHKYSEKMCIVYNQQYEISDTMFKEEGGIAKRYKIKNEMPQFGFLYIMAGIYTLDMNLPHAKEILSILEESEQKQKSVDFYYSQLLQSIYYAEFKK